MDLDQKAAYVAAFLDGEGHVGCHRTAKGFWTRSVSFSNTDVGLIAKMTGFLSDLGIPSRVHFREQSKVNPKWADCQVIYIAATRENFERFLRLIPIQCDRKRDMLDFIVNHSYASPEAKRDLRRNGAEVPCAGCGKAVYRSQAFLRRSAETFCSNVCKAQARVSRVMKSCETCEAPFQANAARRESARFCSLRCFGLSKADRLRAMSSMAAKARWSARRQEMH